MTQHIELEHAVRYATEVTKLYLMKEYKRIYSHIFKDATIETRPADSKQDYYVPESIKDKCIVVTLTRFDETACRRVGCFPFRQDMKPCEKADKVKWIPLGRGYTLSCQPACVEDDKVDTEWIDGECVQVNPYKKLIAMFPEKLFGMEPKQHGGLDWKKGKLYLTEEYCAAYGLDFFRDDCYLVGAQNFGEIIFGQTIVRGLKTINVKGIKRGAPPSEDPSLDFPPHVPRKVKVEALDKMELPESDKTTSFAKELAKELSVDFGIEISAKTISHILKKSAPRLVERAIKDVAFKSSLKQAVFRSTATMGLKAMVHAGKAVSVATGVLAAYGIGALILDIFDPLNYDKSMDLSQLRKIEQRLDMTYFDRENNFLPTLTPEFVWDYVLNMEDETERHEYFADRVKEYIEALRSKQVTLNQLPKPTAFHWQNKLKVKNKTNLWITLFVMLCMLFLYKWIHILTFLLLIVIMMWGQEPT